MNSDEAIAVALKFLKENRQAVKEGTAIAFLPSEEEAKNFPSKAKENWVVRFLIERPQEFEGFSPGHVIVSVNDRTGEASFEDAL
jgi:hypothetical protein